MKSIRVHFPMFFKLLSLIFLLTITVPGHCYYTKVKMDGRVGVKDERGNIVIKPIYDDIVIQMGGVDIVKVKKDGKWGLLDINGRYVIADIIYDDIGDFFEWRDMGEYLAVDSTFKYAIIKHKGKYGIIESNGKLLLDPEFDNYERTFNGCYNLNTEREDRCYILRNNEVSWHVNVNDGSMWKLHKIMTEPQNTSSNIKRIRSDGKYGFAGNGGNILIKPEYDDAGEFFEGMAAVKKNNKWGYINEKGELIIDNKFDDVREFINGIARVNINNEWGFVNKDGKYLFAPKYNYCWDFVGEKAKARLENGDIIYIDKNGNQVK